MQASYQQPGGFGRSDSRTAAPGRQRQLDLISKLGETGAGVDVSLPTILVVGSQSSGKSSLIEGTTGITLPRGTGTCTRCPLECRLRRTQGAWKCSVWLQFIFDKNGRPLGRARNEQFGDDMYDEDEVQERIERAHRAILNPSTDHNNSVSLRISGPDVEDLSFCDLPGLIVNVGPNGNAEDIKLVQDLVTEYISKPACIILLTVTCETDFQNQGGYRLVKKYDSDGSRTIGVLTKPDRIPSGEQESWLQYLKAKTAGITKDEARQLEEDFFSTAPWNTLGAEQRGRLGTNKLRSCLSEVLADAITQMLPDIRRDVDKQLDETDQELTRLPRPSSSDPVLEIIYKVSTFFDELKTWLDGTPDADGLVQTLRPACELFRKAIRATEPDFRPTDRRAAGAPAVAAGPAGGEGLRRRSTIRPRGGPRVASAPEGADSSRVIYLDDVTKRMNEYVARSRELPHHYPNIVAKRYIIDIICEWLAPAEAVFREYQTVLADRLRAFIEAHFAQYPALRELVKTITTEFLNNLADGMRTRIRDLLETEKLVQTLHDEQYSKHYLYYCASLKEGRASPGATATGEDDSGPGTPRQSFVDRLSRHGSMVDLKEGISLALNALNKEDLAKQYPVHESDPALNIMASVCAYFQVSYARFGDNIRNGVDFHFVFGLTRERALERALHKGLGIGSADSPSQCAEYLREPLDIAEHRESLLKKHERLRRAKKELADAGL
ncbi:P-loop containing nucleoside triphosphate hydrolase protein [Ganoderma leucocontextum]|nr:P-loop containing nucleoside triphosphate hydrolase protein [Ganoderma leucocontextum]